jgi:acyl-CoA synthetase (AMP-forming)/AMP-acid ligase II
MHRDEDETKLVVVAEVQRTFLPRLETNTFRTLLADVRAQISDLFGLRLAQLVLIRPGSIPKTSSGKLRRRYCRELHLSDRLDLARIQRPESVAFDEREVP